MALTTPARWYEEVQAPASLPLGRGASTIKTHDLDIISFFERRANNADAQSFNDKLKEFREQFRGVRDSAFFLYRLAK